MKHLRFNLKKLIKKIWDVIKVFFSSAYVKTKNIKLVQKERGSKNLPR
jgi:hypothetical protein